MQQQDKQQSGMKASFNVLYLLVVGWTYCFLPFLRVNMGPSAMGMRGILAMLVMYLFAAIAKCPEMIPFFGVWLVVVIVQRLRTFWLIARGASMHSKHSGDPIVMKLLPFIGRRGTAQLLEVMICFFAGVALSIPWPQLGGFVIFGSFAMAISFGIDIQVIQNRKQAMKDAELEQKYYADLHRGRRNDY